MSSQQTPKKIFLHWSATPYNWAERRHYHCVIGDQGKVQWLTEPNILLTAHTYGRNQDAIAFSIACMGGNGWSSYPPQKKQIEALCAEVAKTAKQFNIPVDIKHIMTHAEAAALRDFSREQIVNLGSAGLSTARSMGFPHDNYGPMGWEDGWPSGTGERWDLWMLAEGEKKGSGGDKLRGKIGWYLKELEKKKT